MRIRYRLAAAATLAVALAGILVPSRSGTPSAAAPGDVFGLTAAGWASERVAGPANPGDSARGGTVGPAEMAAASHTALQALRLVNYYPASHGWSRMWFQWDPAAIRSDFASIRSMGATAVRLVVHPDVFGYPVPSTTMTNRLSDVIAMADADELQVQLTLFDGFRSYGDVAGSRAWAGAILSPFRGDGRIAFVEIQNEIDARNRAAMTWARAMIPSVRAMSELPVAISGQEYGAYNLRGFADLVKALAPAPPDIFSYHLYGDPARAALKLSWAKKLAGATPLFIGETGRATAASATAAVDRAKEHAQLRFFQIVQHQARLLGLPPAAPWILRDFTPGTLSPGVPGTEYRMGLLRADGTPKPAYGWLRYYFRNYGALSGA